MLSRQRKSPILLLLLIMFIGAIIGTVVGEVLGEFIPVVARSTSLGVAPTELHIGNVITFHFGFTLRLNLASILGLIIAVWIFRSF